MTKDERAGLFEELKRIGEETRAFDYIPGRFLQDLATSDPGELVVRYVRSARPSAGFERLWEEGRLDLSVEKVAWRNRHLFAQEVVDVAARRLLAAGFDVRTQKAATGQRP